MYINCAFFSRIPILIAVLLLLTVSCLITTINASPGDQSKDYHSCVQKCLEHNCSTEEDVAKFASRRPLHLFLFRWECDDECEYQCMWYAVEVLKKYGEPLPQFHGKWPFTRILGIQEPASVLFSVLNGLSHVVMWRKFRKHVPSTAPFYLTWKIQALLSVNAWVWSTVFHTRDTPVTEKLDYFCAFSLVLYSLYSLCLRVLRTNSSLLSLTVSIPFVAFFVYHIHYLTFVHFDYGYNMLTNVTAGMLNSAGWIVWCLFHLRRRYVWRCGLTVMLVNIVLLLELGDFPPLWFILDAHALWHLSTIPLPLLWYQFLIDDSRYEIKAAKKKQEHLQNGQTNNHPPILNSLYSLELNSKEPNQNSLKNHIKYT